MKLSIRISLLIGALFCLTVCVNAQKSVIGKKIKSMPKACIDGTDRPIEPFAPANTKGLLNLWVAYSDRDNNQTFVEGKAGAGQLNKMYFMQPVFIIDENENYFHVVEYRANSYDDSHKITADLKDFGWIPRSNLLVWKHAMLDKNTHFTMKCLSVNKLDVLKSNRIKEYADDEKLLLYNEPKKGVSTNGSDVRLYSFMYIYKEEGGYFLVGKGISFEPSGASSNVLGWVDKDIIQLWNQRVAVEPNSDMAAAHERKVKATDIKVFAEAKDAVSYNQKGKDAKVAFPVPFTDRYDQPYPPEWKRFPVIDLPADGSSVIHTGVVSKVYDENGQEALDIDEQYKVSKELETIRENKSKINVVFVIDGARTIQSFGKAINLAIKSEISRMNSLSTQGGESFEFGAVVYRSKADVQSGLKEIEKEDLSTNEQKVIRFTDTKLVQEEVAKTDGPRSLYQGLNTALDMFRKGRKSDQTNVIILIGAESGPQTIEAREIINKAVAVRASFLCFQVYNNETPACNAFVPDMSDIIKDSEKGIRLKYADIVKGSNEVEWNDESDNLLVMRCPESAPVPGSFMWTPTGGQLDDKQLVLEIGKIVQNVIDNNEHIFANGDSKVNGIGKRSRIDEATLNFLSQMNVDPALLEATSDRNIQFFVEGYTPMRILGQSQDMFKYVILVEDREYGDLLDVIARMKPDESTSGELREHIRDAYREAVSAQFGQREAKKMLDQMTIPQINAKLFGLGGYKKTSNDELKIADLENLTDEEVRAIADKYTSKYKLLEEWRNADSPQHFFLNNGLRYFWIPQELLP